MASDWLKPKGLEAKELATARTKEFRFHNPPAYEQFAKFHDGDHHHGEFHSMSRVTGKMPRDERHALDRDRMSEGLAEVHLAFKGRPV